MRKDRIDEERFGQDSCTTNDDDRGGTGTRDPRTEKLIQSGLVDPVRGSLIGTTETEWNEEDEERYRNSRSQLHAYARHVIKSDQADERYHNFSDFWF